MDSGKNHKMSLEEAKERLLYASGELNPAEWTRHHPFEAVTISAILGYIVGSDSVSRSSLKESIKYFLKLL